MKAAVIGLIALLAWEIGGLDLPLSRLYGNATGFAWQHAWWAQTLLHDGARWLTRAMLVFLAWDAFQPSIHKDKGPGKATRLYWLLAIVAALLMAPLFKHFSATSCPWDLIEFGGSTQYVPHWRAGADGGPGHCFPSGHATNGFAFIGLYFLWRAHRPQMARAMLWLALLAGALLGWVQLARGAHFASHVLWSAWICWVGACIAHRLQRSVTLRRILRPAPLPISSSHHGNLRLRKRLAVAAQMPRREPLGVRRQRGVRPAPLQAACGAGQHENGGR